MEMIRHGYKFMAQIFIFCPVIQQDFDEETGDLIDLEETFSFVNIAGDKVGGCRCSTSVRDSQRAPQRLKPDKFSTLPQA
jgi:hypothetical protein